MATTLELEVSDKVVRKLKALSALEGYSSPAQMVEKAAHIFESALDKEISSHLGAVAGVSLRMGNANIAASSRAVQTLSRHLKSGPEEESAPDYDGLSDSLGDAHDYDSEEPEPETDAFAMVPKIGGLSDKEIEHDMDVEDPEHEAAAVPPVQQGPNDDAEDLFLTLAGIPLQMDGDDEIDHRILNRKRKVKLRAKVTGLLEDSQIGDAF